MTLVDPHTPPILTIRDCIAEAACRLKATGIEGARQEAWLLLSKATGWDRVTLLAHAGDGLDDSASASFHDLIERRTAREPIAQILGEKEFWSLPFFVSKDVLCPRPDSETLIEMAISLASAPLKKSTAAGEPYRILDLGTGSGCLVLTLLNELPGSVAIGVDQSVASLHIARANGERLGLSSRITWLCADWGTALGGPFDLIISNPPYVRANDWPGLAPEIRLFEPMTALKAGEDGLDAYRQLAPQVQHLLAPKGLACFEHGQGQAQAIINILASSGLIAVQQREDLAGIERCLAAQHPA